MNASHTRVVYTAVFGGYDTVPQVNEEWNCDFICFTDIPMNVSKGWRVVDVQLNGETPAQMNRRYKILPQIFLSDYEQSLYVDGNIRILSDPSELFDKYLNGNAIALPKHPVRDCIYAEAKVCIEQGLVDELQATQQMARYATDGFPERFGLAANYIILRNHFDARVICLMESWWHEYCAASKRDQLSLLYLCWKNKFKICFMEENSSNNNKFFAATLHTSQKHESLLGRFTDYIICNGQKSNLLRIVFILLKPFGNIKFLRKKLR